MLEITGKKKPDILDGKQEERLCFTLFFEYKIIFFILKNDFLSFHFYFSL